MKPVKRTMPVGKLPVPVLPTFILAKPTLPTPAELTAQVATLLSRASLGSAVMVEVTTDGRPDARALGTTVFNLPIGKITVSTGLLLALTPDEREFVLAHEIAHIVRNHILATGSLVAMRALVEFHAKSEPAFQFLLIAYDALKVGVAASGNLPLDGAILKAQEEEADLYAVATLTGKPAAARSALTKLVKGDLSAPSHTWEAFTVKLPAMTVGERLTVLEVSLQRLLWARAPT